MGSPVYGIGFHTGKKSGRIEGVILGLGISAFGAFITYMNNRKNDKEKEQIITSLEAELKAEKAKNQNNEDKDISPKSE